MNDLPSELKTHLSGQATTVCQCWKLVRTDDVELGFTDHDRDLIWGGVRYEAACGLDPSEVAQTVGLSPDTLDIAGALSSDKITQQDIIAGKYDGARVEQWLVNWNNLQDRFHENTFHFGEVTVADGAFRVELKAGPPELDQTRGRQFANVCSADLGDHACQVDMSQPEYRASGSVTGISGTTSVMVSGLETRATGTFQAGLIIWTTGPNAGLAMEIAEHVNDGEQSLLQLWSHMPTPPKIGDQFQITVGCDKRFKTCKTKFGNEINFQGFPHMPGTDFALNYAANSAAMDGGPLVP